ncbi:MAG TPA: hypothetical protein VHC19_07365 [Pirellulales bacterium]|nr:hypothetical protein [Pirellulales bacterium]
MRLSVFSFGVVALTLLSAGSVRAQTYPTGPAAIPVMVGSAFHPGYSFNYSNPYAYPTGPHNWGYAGTCCSNIWAGYCDEEQGCHHGLFHGGLRCKLKHCGQKLLRSRRHCGCRSHGCGCGHETRCSNGSCCGGPGAYEDAEAPPAELLAPPRPPEPMRPEATPPSYDEPPPRSEEAPSPSDEARPRVRKSYRMPQMTSARAKTRR